MCILMLSTLLNIIIRYSSIPEEIPQEISTPEFGVNVACDEPVAPSFNYVETATLSANEKFQGNQGSNGEKLYGDIGQVGGYHSQYRYDKIYQRLS